MEPTELSVAAVIELLAKGDMEIQGMLPWSSNYTLLASVQSKGLQGLAVYKPRRGERPLWDFPRGTLCQREVAAYLVNEALGWGLVPPTVLRNGEYGMGSLQLFIDSVEDAHMFTMQREGGFDWQLERLAVFDVLTNNADRKSGHCLKGSDGRLWAIDHGLCFHYEPKLRTVLWDYAGQPINDAIMDDVQNFSAAFMPDEPVYNVLSQLLAPGELRALRRRTDGLLQSPIYPHPGIGRSTPWPLV